MILSHSRHLNPCQARAPPSALHPPPILEGKSHAKNISAFLSPRVIRVEALWLKIVHMPALLTAALRLGPRVWQAGEQVETSSHISEEYKLHPRKKYKLDS